MLNLLDVLLCWVSLKIVFLLKFWFCNVVFLLVGFKFEWEINIDKGFGIIIGVLWYFRWCFIDFLIKIGSLVFLVILVCVLLVVLFLFNFWFYFFLVLFLNICSFKCFSLFFCLFVIFVVFFDWLFEKFLLWVILRLGIFNRDKFWMEVWKFFLCVGKCDRCFVFLFILFFIVLLWWDE